MTREENIKWLESLKAEIGKPEHRTLWHYAEAIDMAIEALKEKPTIPMFTESEEAYKAWTGEKIGTYHYCTNCGEKVGEVTECRPHGEWIDSRETDTPWNDGFKCSTCNKNSLTKYNYCPNCGADMRGEE